MGTPLFPFALTLLAAVTAAPDPQVMREERFQTVLAEMDVAAAEQACLDTRIVNSDQRRQAVRDRLLALHPVIDSLELVLANAEALMSCGAPEAAAVVLNRYSPRAGEERRQWLVLRWRAAAAASGAPQLIKASALACTSSNESITGCNSRSRSRKAWRRPSELAMRGLRQACSAAARSISARML